MAEWSKALDLGSSHFDGVGSNPTAATPLEILVFLNYSICLSSFPSASFCSFLTLLKKKRNGERMEKGRNCSPGPLLP